MNLRPIYVQLQQRAFGASGLILDSSDMQPLIYLALTDDWEVRGNGTGDPRVLQFEPMRKLVKIFNNYGIRGSFNAEVMQQLTYRGLQAHFPELKPLADEWEEVMTESFRQGHDIQLHLHPQWRDATYEGHGNWKLAGDWSIINYPSQQVREMLASGKKYLETLLCKIDRAYACVSFRAGSWCAAPSDSLLPILSELGFVFDMSIVAGIRYETPQVKLDYTHCEEPFVPYYPDMKDARRVSRSVEPIVCIPTNSFPGARIASLRQDFRKAGNLLLRKIQGLGHGNSATPSALSRGRSGDEWTNKGERGVFGLARKLAKRYVIGQRYISDIAQMDYSMMCKMMAHIRRQAAKSGLARVPVILENHTKDISSFSDIEHFVADVSRSKDIKTVTLKEIADGFRSGSFTARTA